MFEVRYASENDKSFWFAIDKHFSENEFDLKVRDRRGYIIFVDNNLAGIMRYNLFWDNTPFLTLIYLEEPFRRQGFGSQAMLFWENEMHELGYKKVMTSTQVDEQAQHFYRKLGYKDIGCLIFDNQPQEMFMLKTLLSRAL
jgi:GNAT superfamily N-acetyltransferase